MDRSMKLFLLFCFAVFFFTGCNHGDDKGQVSGPKDPAKAQNKNMKPVPAPIAQEISTGLAMIKELENIYRQVALKGSQHKMDRSKPQHQLMDDKDVQISKNAFRIVSDLFSASFQDNGQRKVVVSKMSRCEGGTADVDTKEVGEDQKKSYSHDLVLRPCQTNGQSTPLANLAKQADGSWKLIFNVRAFSTNEGTPIKILGLYPPYGNLTAELLKEGKESECQIWYDENQKHIDAFDCSFFSGDIKGTQEKEAVRAFLFENMKYRRDATLQHGNSSGLQVVGVGKFYDKSNGALEILAFEVEVPLSDAIREAITETHPPFVSDVKSSGSAIIDGAVDSKADTQPAERNALQPSPPQDGGAQAPAPNPAAAPVDQKSGTGSENADVPKVEQKTQAPVVDAHLQTRDPHLLQQAVDSQNPAQVGVEQSQQQQTSVY